MKDLLKKMLDTRRGKIKTLQERSNASEDVNEVRSIGIEIDQLNEEIRGLEDQIKALEENPAPQVRQQLNPLASYSLGDVRADELDGVDSIEYRTAFMNFVVKREQIPEDVLTRANASTKTSDVASAVPTILINRIIEKMDNVGMILPLVTHTSYAGGVNIPISNVKPTATWVAEGATSDRQKKTTGVITFSYHKLRCEISMSMEVGTLALSAFETKFVENVSKAMVKAREDAIINGDGSGKPKGILKETPNEGQALEIAKAGKLEYKTLISVEQAIPDEYEGSAKWCMSKSTFLSFMGMTDANGQPIARVNYGLNGKIERTLLGRDVIIASTYMPNYQDTVDADVLFAFVFDFADYVENTIYDMGIMKKQDWDTEDLLTKAVMSVDGKVVDKTSLVTLTKKATA